MPCSKDPSGYRCIVRCGKLLNCCNKLCKAQCYICQEQNPGSEEPIQRLRHSPHPCEKRLYCEHQCAEKCSEDHQHTTSCKARCRQICAHAQCRSPCSVPCAPCQEPCTWSVIAVMPSAFTETPLYTGTVPIIYVLYLVDLSVNCFIPSVSL